MKTLDLMESLPEIAGRIDKHDSVLIGLDFDGTLTSLRPRPDDATLAVPVRAHLLCLASIPRVTLMIVSGRSLADVSGRVGLSGLIYAGNHGLEIQGQGLAYLDPTAAALVDPLARLTTHLEELLAEIPGVQVEPKGLTASVHYRNVSPHRWDEVALRVQEVIASDPNRFVLNFGDHVWEIRPRVSWHKGQALKLALQHLGDSHRRLVFYLGDDRTDEDAFADFPEGVTVKIGHPQSSTQARYRLADPAAVERFLLWLTERLCSA